MRAAAPARVRSLFPEQRLRGRRLSAGALGRDVLFLSRRCGFSLPCDPTGPWSPGPVPMAAATSGPFARRPDSRGLSGTASAPAALLYRCGPPWRGRGLVSLTTCPRWGLPLSAAGGVVVNRRLRLGRVPPWVLSLSAQGRRAEWQDPPLQLTPWGRGAHPLLTLHDGGAPPLSPAPRRLRWSRAGRAGGHSPPRTPGPNLSPLKRVPLL